MENDENSRINLCIFFILSNFQNNTKQTSMDEISLKSELIKQKEELIQCLQNELVEVRLQEAENAVIMSDLRSRIQDLEEDKKKLRESVVDNSVAHLQVRSSLTSFLISSLISLIFFSTNLLIQ